MFPVICSTILTHVSMSLSDFDRNENEIMADDRIKAIIKLMNTVKQLPSMQTYFNDTLSKVLTAPQDVNLFEQNFNHFLTEIYEGVFKNDDHANISTANNLSVIYDFIDGILQYIQTNSNQLKAALSNSKTSQIPKVFYNILYWPLSLALNRIEVSVFFFCNTADQIKFKFFH